MIAVEVRRPEGALERSTPDLTTQRYWSSEMAANASNLSEIWRIVDCEPDFEVSSCGQVRRLRACSGRVIGAISSQIVHRKGYLRVSLRGRPYYVHRLVVTAFIGPIPEGLVVNHKDGDKQNNTVANLEVVSVSENNRHARNAGKGGAKLTLAIAEQARAERANGASTVELMSRYGLSRSGMKRLIRGESYVSMDA